MDYVRAPGAGVRVGCARILARASGPRYVCDDDSPWLSIGSQGNWKDVVDVPEVRDQPQTDGNPTSVTMAVVAGGRGVGDGWLSEERMAKKKAIHEPGRQLRCIA